MRFHHQTAIRLAGAALCLCAFCTGVRGDGDEAAEARLDPAAAEELAYVKALVEANMPDFAGPVIAAAKAKWPVLGPKLKVFEVQGDLRLGKFEQVQKVLDGLKKGTGEYWSIRLAMADAYYSRSRMDECSKIYKEFFASVPKPGPDIRDFYVNSGFKWAQMLVIDKKLDEAVKMYESLLSKIPPRAEEELWCTVAQPYVELLVRVADEIPNAKDARRADYLARATKVVDQLLWKQHLIIVFGKAIAMKAHIEMLRGNIEKAQKIVVGYLPQLSEIHNSLVEQDPRGVKGYVRMSPMPECRYLLARLLWQTAQREAKKPTPNEDKVKDALFGAKDRGRRNGLGAYNHAINVYVKYPESAWAAKAGDVTEQIEKFVKDRYKKEIRTNVTAGQMKKVRQMQFKNAWDVFKSNDLPKTVEVYSALVAQFPEVDETPGALSVLAQSYIGLWADEKDKDKKLYWRLAAEAVEGYLAERFSELRGGAFMRVAGDEIQRLAAFENDSGALGRSGQLYEMYFRNYPAHYSAAQTMLSLAAKAYQKEDWAAAARYYEMVATSHTNSTHYANALNYLAVCNGKMGNHEAQAVWLRRFSEAATRPTDKISARLQLANMQQKRGFAAFAEADAAAEGTNDVAAVEAAKNAAFRLVAASIRDFVAVEKLINETLAADKSMGAEAKNEFLRWREQAQCVVGASWSRLSWPAAKVPLFRAQAVKAFEKYLADNPSGTWAPLVLVKLATIYMADKKADEAKQALARLQKDFPNSNEAKNSVPRLAKTLIDMGLKQEGVEQYRQMLAAGGKYTAGQFLLAGDALLEARGFDVAEEAYKRAIALAAESTNAAVRTSVTAKAMLGQAKVSVANRSWAEAHGRLDDLLSKYGGTSVAVEAYELLVEVASEDGAAERDNDRRRRLFNDAVGTIKRLRGFRKTEAEQDLLTLRSGDVLVKKMKAEEQMGLADQARETCASAVVMFTVFLQSREPTESKPAKSMTPVQLANLERCYSTLLPLMVKLGKEQSEQVLAYGAAYLDLFPDGRHKAEVQNAMAAAEADK